MIIGGVEKLTLIDYPGKLAAIIFTQGCNFRCQFCYNPMLVWPIGDIKLRYQKDHSAIPRSDLFGFLESRRGKLDGVVVTGGEPTLHPDLPEFLADIKALGYAIKLDTNGTNPELLERVLAAKTPLEAISAPPTSHTTPATLIEGQVDQVQGKEAVASPVRPVDYLAMDIKAPLDKYELVVGVPINRDNIKKSIELIKSSGLPYEFRTTLVPGLHTLKDIAEMGQLIQGADKWYLQFFKSDTPLVNADFEQKAKFTHAEMEAMAEEGAKWVGVCEVRG